MSSDTKSVLTNSEVIAINQDPLAKQGAKLSGGGTGLEIYNKTALGYGPARRPSAQPERSGGDDDGPVCGSSVSASTASVRNVWAAMDLGTKTTSYDVSVPAHDSVLLLVTQ